MAKTYLTTVKYQVKIKFDIDGVVEKEDIIGAVFGQSEGLLGDEMDLKELQQSGKLGRIEVTHKSEFGKTYGDLVIPSSMNMPETSLLAAAVESVEKVGPCDAKFEVLNITDVRMEKRGQIKERAKLLLERFKKDQMPNAVELADEIKESARELSVAIYGNDKLACGPEIEKEEEIIVVEGRADVMNLLRNNIKNVIEMGGANVSNDVVELSKKKETTLFIDGDRGGELNSRKLMQIASIDYLARAPDGKEVEELARKEILLALKRKEMVSEGGKTGRSSGYEERSSRRPSDTRRREPRDRDSRDRAPRDGFRERRSFGRDRGPRDRPPGRTGFGRGRGPRDRPYDSGFRQESEPAQRVEATEEETTKFRPLLDVMKGSMKARLFNPAMEEILSTDVRNIMDALQQSQEVYAIVFDGITTKRLVDAAQGKSVKYLVGIRKANVGDTKDVKVLVL